MSTEISMLENSRLARLKSLSKAEDMFELTPWCFRKLYA